MSGQIVALQIGRPINELRVILLLACAATSGRVSGMLSMFQGQELCDAVDGKICDVSGDVVQMGLGSEAVLQRRYRSSLMTISVPWQPFDLGGGA